jgi:phenylacetate-CoA ligase
MLDNQLSEHCQRLADMLWFAKKHIPHYQKHLPPIVEDLVSQSHRWMQVPLLNKHQIQNDWVSFLVNPSVINDPSTEVLSTSGSTGTPLQIARPKHELRIQTRRLWAARARWHPDIMRWKQLNLYLRLESPFQDALRLDVDDTYVDLSFCALGKRLDQIDDYGPDWIYGSPSAVHRLAQHYRLQQRSLPTLKLIETTGEVLFPHYRRLIESTFGCPVVNHYGSREFGVLSYECPARSMHAWTDDLLLEVVRGEQPVSPGETGELVVTSLTNRIMPLIRYKLGDLVQMFPSDCSCGDPRPILTPVEGREGVLIVTHERTVTDRFLTKLFCEFAIHYPQSLLEYQVVQPDYDRLDIYLVPGERFDRRAAAEKLVKGIHEILPELRCQFIVCSSIAPLPSGKTKTFISHVDPDIRV